MTKSLRFSFGISALLAVGAIVAIPMSRRANEASRQRRAIATVEAGEAAVSWAWAWTVAERPKVGFFASDPVTYLGLTGSSKENVRCDPEVFAAIGEFHELETLVFSDIDIDSSCVDRLPQMPTVRELQWFRKETRQDDEVDEALRQLLRRFPNLRKLAIGGLPVTDAQIYELSELSDLEELTILGAHLYGSFVFDLTATKLESLTVDSDVLSQAFLYGLQEIPTIRYVNAARSNPLPLRAVAASKIDHLDFLSFRIASPLSESDAEAIESTDDPQFSVSVLHESATPMGGNDWSFERVRLP